MCPPVLALSSFVVGASQAILGHQANVAEARARNARADLNRQEANRALVERFATQQNQIITEQNATSQELQNVRSEGLSARSTAIVAAGEAGISGLSVDALLGEFVGRQGRFESALDTNFQQRRDFLRGEMEAARAQAASRINSGQTVSRPTFTGSAIRILGSAIDTTSRIQTRSRSNG